MTIKNDAKGDQFILERIKNLMITFCDNVPEKGGWSNPMRGHKAKLIFTRITGHPDIKDAHYWKDTSDDWIREKWTKTTFRVCGMDMENDKEFEDIISLTNIINRFRKKIKEDNSQLPKKNKLKPLEEE